MYRCPYVAYSVYGSGLPALGEPGSCECGNAASPSCEYELCAACCPGCARHPREEEEDDALPAPGEPGSCQCGQTASRSCAQARCRACCRGPCAWHYGEPEPQPEPDHAPGGLCLCGQPAAVACVQRLCASCCGDPRCPRHRPGPAGAAGRYSDTASEEEGLAWLGGPVFLDMLAGAMAVRDAAARGAAARQPGAPGGAAPPPPPGQPPPMLEDLGDLLGGRPQQQQQHHHQQQQQPGGSRHAAGGAGRSSAAQGAAAPGHGGSSGSTQQDAERPVHRGAGSAEEALVQLMNCVVCLDAPRSVLLLPCKHLAMCSECSDALVLMARRQYAAAQSDSLEVRCPVCREPAAQRLRGVILS